MFETEADGILEVRRLHPRASLPERTRPGDAAYDLRTDEGFTLRPGERRRASTGVALCLAEGVAGLVVPRSGLAANYGITLLNSPGLIDPNYRGEVGIVLHNAGDRDYEVAAGDRVAQLLLVRFAAPEPIEVEELRPAVDERGADGFGSSGR